MTARAEFTVRPRHLKSSPLSSRMRGSMGFIFRYNDTGHLTFGIVGWWKALSFYNHLLLPVGESRGLKLSHKCVGEYLEYWSSSPYAGNATNAWNVNFNNGNDNANNKSNNNYVRLVRGGE